MRECRLLWSCQDSRIHTAKEQVDWENDEESMSLDQLVLAELGIGV